MLDNEILNEKIDIEKPETPFIKGFFFSNRGKLFFAFPLSFLLFMLLTAVNFSFDEIQNTNSFEKSRFQSQPMLHYEFLPLKDTIYILADSYVTISLKEQLTTVYRKGDIPVSFKISSGTDKIHKGMTTPVGIYTIQTKTPKAISKQFNNAELFNWIGFHGNIGFHGLTGTGYYSYLGVRPSSHGCVRIARECGEKLYEIVKIGDPVLVFDDEPAAIIAFSKESDINPNRDFVVAGKINRRTKKLLEQRLERLYSGRAYENSYSKVFLGGKLEFPSEGMPSGRAADIAFRQKRFVEGFIIQPVPADALRRKTFFNPATYENDEEDLSQKSE